MNKILKKISLLSFLTFYTFLISQETEKSYSFHFEETPCNLLIYTTSAGYFNSIVETKLYRKKFFGLIKTHYTITSGVYAQDNKNIQKIITDFEKNWNFYLPPPSKEKQDQFIVIGLKNQKEMRIAGSYFHQANYNLPSDHPFLKLQLFHKALLNEVYPPHYINLALKTFDKGIYCYQNKSGEFCIKK